MYAVQACYGQNDSNIPGGERGHRQTLKLLGAPHLIEGDAKGLAVLGVQAHLGHDVPHNVGGLRAIHVSRVNNSANSPGGKISTHPANVGYILGLVRRQGVGSSKVSLHTRGQSVTRKYGGCRRGTDQVEIVLDNVPLKGLDGERPVAHGHDKGMVHKPVPHILDIRPRQEIFDKVAPGRASVQRRSSGTGSPTARTEGCMSSGSGSEDHGPLPTWVPS